MWTRIRTQTQIKRAKGAEMADRNTVCQPPLAERLTDAVSVSQLGTYWGQEDHLGALFAHFCALFRRLGTPKTLHRTVQGKRVPKAAKR